MSVYDQVMKIIYMAWHHAMFINILVLQIENLPENGFVFTWH